MRKPSPSFMKKAALLCFGGYCAWNVSCLLSWQLPDSILRAVTGLPCPTTGGTRSAAAYLRGDWELGFWYNPLAPVFPVLLLASGAILAQKLCRRQEPRLPSWLAQTWLWCLLIAWFVKLVVGPQFW